MSFFVDEICTGSEFLQRALLVSADKAAFEATHRQSFTAFLRSFGGALVMPTSCENVVFLKFADTPAREVARAQLLLTQHLSVSDVTAQNLMFGGDDASLDESCEQAPLPLKAAAPKSPPVALVYGESDVQRVPVSPLVLEHCHDGRFSPVAVTRTDLLEWGVDVASLGEAELSVSSGSLVIGVHGVDAAEARRVADWVLDTPMVAELVECVAYDAAKAAAPAGSELVPPVRFVRFFAHNCVTPSQGVATTTMGQWLMAPPEWILEPITDSSAKALAESSRRAVERLMPLLRDNVFVLVISPSLPLVQILAPDFWRQLRSAEHKDSLTWTDKKTAAHWPYEVVAQIRARDQAPRRASWCVPKEGALLLFGIRGDEKSFSAAHAIVQSVKRRAPKRDLPMFTSVSEHVLWDLRRSEPGPKWVCLLQANAPLFDDTIERVIKYAKLSPNVRLIDVCGTRSLTLDHVRRLLAIKHVELIGIVNAVKVHNVEEKLVARFTEAERERLVWMRKADVFDREARDAVYERHCRFFSYSEQAHTAWAVHMAKASELRLPQK